MIWYAKPRKEYQDCYRCANKCTCEKFSRHVHDDGPWPGFEECTDFEDQTICPAGLENPDALNCSICPKGDDECQRVV